jgi:hypothetical protein
VATDENLQKSDISVTIFSPQKWSKRQRNNKGSLETTKKGQKGPTDLKILTHDQKRQRNNNETDPKMTEIPILNSREIPRAGSLFSLCSIFLPPKKGPKKWTTDEHPKFDPFLTPKFDHFLGKPRAYDQK